MRRNRNDMSAHLFLCRKIMIIIFLLAAIFLS